MATDDPPVPTSIGLAACSSQDQVLRNHAVGSTCNVSASGPALVTSMVISTSVGSSPLAYQTSVIQYRSSSKTPVSSSSYSGSYLLRCPFCATRSW